MLQLSIIELIDLPFLIYELQSHPIPSPKLPCDVGHCSSYTVAAALLGKLSTWLNMFMGMFVHLSCQRLMQYMKAWLSVYSNASKWFSCWKSAIPSTPNSHDFWTLLRAQAESHVSKVSRSSLNWFAEADVLLPGLSIQAQIFGYLFGWLRNYWLNNIVMSLNSLMWKHWNFIHSFQNSSSYLRMDKLNFVSNLTPALIFYHLLHFLCQGWPLSASIHPLINVYELPSLMKKSLPTQCCHQPVPPWGCCFSTLWIVFLLL